MNESNEQVLVEAAHAETREGHASSARSAYRAAVRRAPSNQRWKVPCGGTFKTVKPYLRTIRQYSGTFKTVKASAYRAAARRAPFNQRWKVYRGVSLIRNSTPLGPYHVTMPRALRWLQEGGGLSYD